MERVFSQLNVVNLKLNNMTSAELVNAILNVMTELKSDNIIKHVTIMTEIPEAVTMWSFIGTSLACNEKNTAKSCLNADNCDFFVEYDSSLYTLFVLFFVCLFLLHFSLFWSFFQAHLLYLRETEVATLVLCLLGLFILVRVSGQFFVRLKLFWKWELSIGLDFKCHVLYKCIASRNIKSDMNYVLKNN